MWALKWTLYFLKIICKKIIINSCVCLTNSKCCTIEAFLDPSTKENDIWVISTMLYYRNCNIVLLKYMFPQWKMNSQTKEPSHSKSQVLLCHLNFFCWLRVWMCTLWCMCEGQRTSFWNWFSSYTIWVPGIKVTLSDLAALPLPAEASCQSVFVLMIN